MLAILRTHRQSRVSRLKSMRPVRVFAAIIGILLCILIVIDGPAIAAVIYTKWEIRNAPELWVVPTPLTDLSIERSAGQKFSYWL